MLESIKNKIANLAGNETLGEAATKKEDQEKSLKRKRSKLKKEVTPIPQNESVFDDPSPTRMEERIERAKVYRKKREKKKEQQQEKREQPVFEPNTEDFEIISSPTTDKKSSEINVVENAVEGYQDVLSMLGIKESVKLDVSFKSDDLDYVEFTQTTPLGFDFDEVTDFISRAKYTMHKLETALNQRDQDIIRLASEVKKVEKRMIEQAQEKELAKMMGGMTEEERLIEENMELKVEINELSRKLKDVSESSQSVSGLNKEVEALRSENEFLRMNSLNKPLPKQEVEPSSNENEDPFSEMLEDIGGLYDE